MFVVSVSQLMKALDPIQPIDHAVCRSPIFPIETSLKEAWPTLQRLIRESAPQFHELIAGLTYGELDQQPEKVRYTIWKYFNRSRYRATPFGEFAGVSLVPISDTSSPIILQKQMEVLCWPDWHKAPTIVYDYPSITTANYRTSPLCYAYGNEYHYLFRSEKQFELNAILQRGDIDLVLNYCKELRSFDDLATVMMEGLRMKRRNLAALIRQLLELQVLHCDLQANITGQDYFQRRQFSDISDKKYTMASRAVISGGLSKSVAEELKHYANFMGSCLPDPAHPPMEQFKKSFLQLWEQRSVPLSLALDPIMGIGYGHDAEFLQTGLVGELQRRTVPAQGRQVPYNPFEQFILRQLVKGKEIQLDAFTPEETLAPLPNTTNILFHLYDDHPVIHHAGGATAVALLGRFTPMEAIHQLSLQLTRKEQQAHRQTVFFDIAYQFEGRTDNVNRRQQLYETELAIGSWSTMAAPLMLEDILVSIRQGQIILTHRVSGKRLVPRMASAYNHQRSDLDLFKFLCDLQYQGIQSKLSFDLQAMFPNLDHYPRVYYKQVIACPAKWRLPKLEDVNSLLGWLAEQGLMHPFTVGQGDQTLVINPEQAGDLHYLLLYQKQQKGEVYITEALVDSIASVSTWDAGKLHAQFILPITHEKEVYPNPTGLQAKPLRRDQRLPGSEWCYIEFYMRPELMDTFLANEIRYLIQRQKPLIEQWFFIRYNQPEPHLRVRLKLRHDEALPAILQSIQSLTKIDHRYGPLRRLEIKSYDREIMRYGERQMHLAERFFFMDSQWALRQLHLDDLGRYSQIIAFAQQLCRVVFEEPAAQTAFFRQLADSFSAEMNFSQDDFKKINQAFHLQLPSERTHSRLVNYFRKMLGQYTADDRPRLLADLIHMHVNRMFSGAPRMHEAVIYQFLYKFSLRDHHQKNKGATSDGPLP